MNVRVIRAGPFTTVQDEGRKGHRHLGVSAGGALDDVAARVANLLVGNSEADAVIEVTLGGVTLKFSDERLIAWCGGDFNIMLRDVAIRAGRSVPVQPGDELQIEGARNGCRAWIAISGGIDVPVVLDSRSTDVRAGFGGHEGRPLTNGDEIALGAHTEISERLLGKARGERIAARSASAEWTSTASKHPLLRFVRGAQWEEFDETARRDFSQEPFKVTAEADRMGIRFEGPALMRRSVADLTSEAVAPGTIQVPPSGKPILLLNDCQTLGGYPKIGHVITVDLPIAAQLRTGVDVRFREVSLAEAHALLCERERDIDRFRIGLQLQM